MSNTISFGLLTQRREDAVKMEVRAKELLKELDPNSGLELKSNSMKPTWIVNAGLTVCGVSVSAI